jgi:uncharacterized protein (TIGR02466 family)
MPGKRDDWFPTSIWSFDGEDNAALNVALLQAIYEERARDTAGMTGRSSSLSWHSQDDLHRRPAFEPLMRQIIRNVSEVIRFQEWDLTRLTPGIVNCWAIVHGRHGYNRVHTHPHSYLSGVYYVQAPEGSGDLYFEDPRSAHVMTMPPVLRQTPATFQKVTYPPRAGRMLVFPAWVPHGVEPNLSDGDRVCLSFNIGARWSD